MKRRAFLALPAAMALSPPRNGAAQQAERLRRVGVIVTSSQNDPDAQARAAALRDGLRDLGWVENRNLTIDYRWSGGDPVQAAAHADSLVALGADVIVSNGMTATTALQRRTRSIPIVFAVLTNPVGAGFVESLARPGGNITGFSTFEPEIAGKWFETLREFSPTIRRMAVISDFTVGGFAALEATVARMAEKSGIPITPIRFANPADDLEGRIAAFAAEASGGLISMPTSLNLLARDRLIATSARHRLPAIYPFRPYVESGGLMSYGFEPIDLFRRSATYVDRILKGERPAELPVQGPTRFQFILNMKTAQALGIDIPSMLLARADELID
jgi:putative ABC transport system substrate-binding protein